MTCPRLLPCFRAIAVAALALASLPVAGEPATVRDAIHERLDILATAGRLDIRGVTLGPEDVLTEYYARRGYEPAWLDAGRTAELTGLLAGAAAHGLDPEDFFLSTLNELEGLPGIVPAAERDLLLTEALIRYGYQRRFGKVNPARMEPAWNFARGFANGSDPVAILDEAIRAPSLAGLLQERIPGGPWYEQLQAALARYRALDAAGGWPPVPPGPVLQAGDAGPRVDDLRRRLAAEGDLPAAAAGADGQPFDEVLARAVGAFQERHALAADGRVGPATLRELNVTARERLDMLRLSLERVRWLSGDVPATYVVVNVAAFRVGLVRDRRLAWTSRVVVGRAARQTPIFRGTMTYVELNPTWTVPPTILREDILPKLKRDPGYLRRENISVIDRQGRLVDPFSVDWRAYSRGVPYTLRQEPGPANSLGRIKLMFPNAHAVYLHDTPAKELFDRPERTFSSGCIRVEDPLALAELVLDDPQWNRASLEAAIAEGRTRRVNLRRPLPVLLVYLTAIADPDGTARFFRDVYGRDAALLAALDGPVRLELPGAAAAKLGSASL